MLLAGLKATEVGRWRRHGALLMSVHVATMAR